MQESGVFLVPGGVTGDIVLNVMSVIIDVKDKNAESTANNIAVVSAMKAVEIASYCVETWGYLGQRWESGGYEKSFQAKYSSDVGDVR